MKFALSVLGLAASLIACIVVGVVCVVSRIPGVVEPGYLHTDDKKQP